MRVYFDNAATTQVDSKVLEEMLPFLQDQFGNPSSTHSHGREVRAVIEKARKKVAEILGVTSSEIFFTSGGTESDNTFLRGAAKSQSITHLISSSLEHHAVLHTMEDISRQENLPLLLVNHDEKGRLDIHHLETLLKAAPRALLSLMHGNNEVGNLTNIDEIGQLSEKYGAVFHSDTVQTVGHFPIKLSEMKVHAIVGSAHKFHGPKGVGFLYVKKGFKVPSYVTGGGQERGMRGGTENVAGIVALAKALEMATENQKEHKEKILELKKLMCSLLKDTFGNKVAFNGNCEDVESSLYTVLNVSLPQNEVNSMLLFTLDLHGISASGGSACSSGAQLGSHVLQALNSDGNRGNVRFSFSKFNTEEEVRFTVQKLAEVYQASV